MNVFKLIICWIAYPTVLLFTTSLLHAQINSQRIDSLLIEFAKGTSRDFTGKQSRKFISTIFDQSSDHTHIYFTNHLPKDYETQTLLRNYETNRLIEDSLKTKTIYIHRLSKQFFVGFIQQSTLAYNPIPFFVSTHDSLIFVPLFEYDIEDSLRISETFSFERLHSFYFFNFKNELLARYLLQTTFVEFSENPSQREFLPIHFYKNNGLIKAPRQLQNKLITKNDFNAMTLNDWFMIFRDQDKKQSSELQNNQPVNYGIILPQDFDKKLQKLFNKE